MELNDLPKDIRRILLDHWTETEINERLMDPVYFIDQVANPRLDYLRRQGQSVPRLRIQRLSDGELRIFMS